MGTRRVPWDDSPWHRLALAETLTCKCSGAVASLLLGLQKLAWVWPSCWIYKAFKALQLGNVQNKDSDPSVNCLGFLILCHFYMTLLFALSFICILYGMFKVLVLRGFNLAFVYPWVSGASFLNFFLQGKLMHRNWQLMCHNCFLLLLPYFGIKRRSALCGVRVWGVSSAPSCAAVIEHCSKWSFSSKTYL